MKELFTNEWFTQIILPPVITVVIAIIIALYIKRKCTCRKCGKWSAKTTITQVEKDGVVIDVSSRACPCGHTEVLEEVPCSPKVMY